MTEYELELRREEAKMFQRLIAENEDPDYFLGKWDLRNYLLKAIKDPQLGERVSRVWDVVQMSQINRMMKDDPYWELTGIRYIRDAFWAYFECEPGKKDLKRLDENFRSSLGKLVTSIEME